MQNDMGADAVMISLDQMRAQFSDFQVRMLEKQSDIVERLTRIEASSLNETVAQQAIHIATLSERVNKLESSADRREGASQTWLKFLNWWGPISWTIGGLGTFIWILLHSVIGVVSSPSDHAIRAIASEVAAHKQSDEQ